MKNMKYFVFYFSFKIKFWSESGDPECRTSICYDTKQNKLVANLLKCQQDKFDLVQLVLLQR